MVELIRKEMDICKESYEIFVFVSKLIKEIKKGSDVPVIIADCLNPLMEAIKGFEKLPEEVKNGAFYLTAGVGLSEMVEAILEKED